MIKLLLTSDGFVNPKIAQEFLKLLDKNPADVKVLFIPTAAEYKFENKEEMFYVKESEKELIVDLGIKKENIFWLDISNIPVAGDLDSYDVIYVCGGNTFYMADKFKKAGFDKKLIDLINSGKVYVGVSAGSYIVCPTIEMAYWKRADNNIVGLKDLTGLNLIPFLLSVHYKPEYAEILEKEIALSKYPVKILTDGQAIEVLGDTAKIIE